MHVSKKTNKKILIDFLYGEACLSELIREKGIFDKHKMAELSNLPVDYIKTKNAQKILNEFYKKHISTITFSNPNKKTIVKDFIGYVSKNCINDYKNPAIVLTVLKAIINSFNKTNTDEIDDIFNTNENSYAQKINSIFSEKKDNTKEKYIKIAQRIYLYYLSYLANNALPDDFREAIKLVHMNSGMKIRQVERIANIKKDKAKSIVRGLYIPRDKTIVAKLEKAYNLPPHTFLNKICKHNTSSNICINDIPAEFKNEYVRIRPHLNDLSFDFAAAPYEKKLEACKWITENIIINNNDYSKNSVVNLKNRYRYTDLSPSPILKEEIERLIHFKESLLPEANYTKETSWRESTSSKNKNSLLYFYGFIDKYNKIDKLERKDYSLSLLVHKETVYNYIHFKIKRRGKICSDDIQFLALICSLLREKFGFISQTKYHANSKIIKKLIEIDVITGLESENISQNNWIQLCSEARSYYQDLIKQLNSTYKKLNIDRNGHIAMSRDPFKPIEPILNSKEPLKEYLNLLSKAREKCVSPSLNPKQYLTFMSGYLSLSIILQTGLRAKNMRSLEFCDGSLESSEQIFKINDKYYIDVPANKVKNCQRNYSEISNTNNLYKDIEDYISIKKMIFGETDKTFIVTINNKNFSESSFSRMVRNFTKLYICYHKYKDDQGIENLQPHGPHSLRDIIATHVVKKTGSFALAAMAIHDSEQTVRKHYARFLPSDKSELIRELTSDIFN